MECFNCGALLTGKDFCEKCGVDVKIYKKIIKTSNTFYNEGLERASVRDLSGAVNSLKKSLELNKLNIDEVVFPEEFVGELTAKKILDMEQ